MDMNKSRFLLYPLVLVYGGIVKIRNKCFDWGILKSHQIEIPSIGVGNLSVGGTGKSVVVDYLISFFKAEFQVAVLSRGYGRSSKGVQIATRQSTSSTIGDEPFQFFSKHSEIQVIVAEQRRKGIQKLNDFEKKVNVLLLDDIMQHRFVKPSALLMTTTFDAPYFSDTLLPVGRLREHKSGAQRAQVVLVTKCPEELSETRIRAFSKKLTLNPDQLLFFTKIKYSASIRNNRSKKTLKNLKSPFLLVTGIADSAPLVSHLKTLNLNFKHLSYSDHHYFSSKELKQIKKESKGELILTTEKDYTRLHPLMENENVYYLPIEMEFLNPKMEIEFKNFLRKTISET
jgi:tetraacyldisaccharide 4'-kinase